LVRLPHPATVCPEYIMGGGGMGGFVEN
jgi:hypothetical protein